MKTRGQSSPKTKCGLDLDPDLEAEERIPCLVAVEAILSPPPKKTCVENVATPKPKSSPKHSQPEVEAIASSQSKLACFICGCDDLVTSTTVPSRRLYLKQLAHFRSQLELIAPGAGGRIDDTEAESCAVCLLSIKNVWDLHQEIEAIQQDVRGIVSKSLEIMREGGRLEELICPEMENTYSSQIRSISPLKKKSLAKAPTRGRGRGRPSKSRGGGHSGRSVTIVDQNDFDLEEWEPHMVNVKEEPDEANLDFDNDAEMPEVLDFGFGDEEWDEGIGNKSTGTPVQRQGQRASRKSKSKARAFLRELSSSTSKRKLKTEDDKEQNANLFKAELDDDQSETETSDQEFAISPLKRHRKTKLRSHPSKNNKSQSKIVECGICKKSFLSPAALRHHKITTHKLTPTSTCDTCSRKFFDDAELQAHVNSSHKPADFFCSACGKQLSSRRNLAIHEVIICGVVWEEKELGSMGLQLLTCDHEGCGKKFAKMAEFKRHTLTHSTIKRFSCPTCSKPFKHQVSLNLHLSTLCVPPEKEACDPAVSASIRARRSLNAKKPKPFRCSFCPRRFITPHMMRIHQERRHTSAEESRAICYLCGASVSSTHLPIHIRRVHEKAYSDFCPIPGCGKAFFNPSELKAHTLRAHTEGGGGGRTENQNMEKTLKCSYCPQMFRHPSTLSKHEARVHLTVEPKYNCAHCEFKFYAKPDLVRHMKTHSRSGVDCSQCGRHFQHEFRLKIHYERDLCGKKVKNNGEEAKRKRIGWCDICERIVGDNKWLLKRHRREVHPEVVGAVIAIPGTQGTSSLTELKEDRKMGEGDQIIFLVPDPQQEVEVENSTSPNCTLVPV